MSDRLITVATFDTPAEAGIAKTRLDAEGVRAFLADEAAVGMVWHLTGALRGIKLQVSPDDADRAVSILEMDAQAPPGEIDWSSYETDPALEPQADGDEEDECESPTDELVSRALRAAVLGLIFLPLQIYSLWLLVRIAASGVPLSGANRRMVWTAAILDMVIVAFLVVVFRAAAR